MCKSSLETLLSSPSKKRKRINPSVYKRAYSNNHLPKHDWTSSHINHHHRQSQVSRHKSHVGTNKNHAYYFASKSISQNSKISQITLRHSRPSPLRGGKQNRKPHIANNASSSHLARIQWLIYINISIGKYTVSPTCAHTSHYPQLWVPKTEPSLYKTRI